MSEEKARETAACAPVRLTAGDEVALRQSAQGDLVLLSRLHGAELDAESLKELRDTSFAQFIALLPESDEARQALSVIDRGWKVLDEPGEARLLDVLAADYAATYLTYQHRVAPTESVWLTEDSLDRQEPMLEVRKWYERFGAAATDWRKMPDDHIALQLAFLAHALMLRDEDGAFVFSLEDAARFLDAHLLLWLDDFAAAAAAKCDTPFYAGLAMFTRAWVMAFRTTLERLTGIAPPTEEDKARAKKSIQPAAEETEQPYVPGMGPAV